MLYVFVSYCRENQDTVKALAQDIGGLGHKVWFDRELAGGYAWWDQILAVIRECDVFLFALAPKSLDSAACKLEYKYASVLGKTVLPVLVADGVSVNLLPPELSKIQHVDYRRQDKQAAIEVLKALSGLPKSPPLPDPLPGAPPPPVSYLGGLMERIEATGQLTFEEQAALVLELKEGLSSTEHRQEVHALLTRFKKRDDLYARIGAEIDVVLAPNARAQPNSQPFTVQSVAAVAAGEKPPSSMTTPPLTDTPRSKWRSVLRGLLALIGGCGAAVGSVEVMIDERILNSSVAGPAFLSLWPIYAVILWFVLPLFLPFMRRKVM